MSDVLVTIGFSLTPTLFFKKTKQKSKKIVLTRKIIRSEDIEPNFVGVGVTILLIIASRRRIVWTTSN